MTRTVFYDTETCSLHSIAVLIQYAYDDGPIHLHEVWKVPVCETMALIEDMMTCYVVGYNQVFDHYHLSKIYNMWRLLPHDLIPESDIDLVKSVEHDAIWGPCLKPVATCDLMLVARSGRHQSLMKRHPINIRRVPVAMAEDLCQELEERIHLDDIYFAKSSDPSGPRWKVYEIEDEKHLVDVRLTFNPAGGLKFLAEFALNKKPPFHFDDVAIDKDLFANDLGYAPFHDAQPNGWDTVVHHHIKHWHDSEPARCYAELDVEYTRDLYVYFGSPEPGDDDSELATHVASARLRGFRVDVEKLKKCRRDAEDIVRACSINVNSANQVREYLTDVMDEIEALFISETTNKAKLTEIATSPDWADNPEAVARASEINAVRSAIKEIEVYDKLIHAGRAHFSFSVIGARTNRMSGAGTGVNSQGIKSAKYVRECFPIADEHEQLSLGDYTSYENFISCAVYPDAEFEKVLTTSVECCGSSECIKCNGTGKYKAKLHTIMGVGLYGGDHESILSDKDKYTKAKSAVYALSYQGNAQTLNRNLGVTIEIAEQAMAYWAESFPDMAAKRDALADQFMAMSQPGGLGTAVVYEDPPDFTETILGFKRFFTLENKVCKALFQLAQAPPKHWRKKNLTVVRRQERGPQTGSGAIASALYGAAFAIQSANMRQACNTQIQSVGATICKRTQRSVCDIQPVGIHEFRVRCMNVHDELLVASQPEYVDDVSRSIEGTVEDFRKHVPLLEIDWEPYGETWADK